MDSGLRRGFATASTQYTPSFFDLLNYHFCLASTQGEKVMNIRDAVIYVLAEFVR